MRRNLIWILAGLIMCGLLIIASSSLAEEDTWARKADMPTARDSFPTSVVNGKIYAIGGWLPGDIAIATVEEYDPATDTWTRKTDMPTARDTLSTSVVNGKIYAIGGLKYNPWRIFSTVEEYDPVADKWTRKADMPTARWAFSTSVVDGKIYAIGGIAVYARGWDGLSRVEVYDPATDTWTRKADMPTARGDLSTSVVDGKIYAIGGVTAYVHQQRQTNYPTVEVYDPATDTWTRKADMPTAREWPSTSVVDGKIYAIGGMVAWVSALSTVEIYDPVTDKWEAGLDMPTARRYLSTSAVNGKIYAIGGSTAANVPLATVEEYDTGVGIPWIRVMGVSPQEGNITGGELIAVSGDGFPAGASVTIGGKPLTQIKVANTLITGVIPPGTEGGHAIVIATPRPDYSVLAGRFFYNPLSNIVVTRMTPTNGKQAGGDTGSITGSGFLPGATVTIGDNQATDVGVTTTLITFTIPPGDAGAKDVVVTNPDGQKGILRGGYTYNPFPVIEEISPEYGGPLEGGTEIIITGEYFMEGVVVYIGEKRVSRLALFSPIELRLETPSGTQGAKDIRVVNPDGQEAVLDEGFTYNPAPTVIGVKPDAGALEGGTRITITGTGFLDRADLLVGGTEASSVKVVSSTKIRAMTPPSDAGVKDVVVINPDGQKATLKDVFTYNHAPDITSVTPNNGRLSGGVSITIRGSGFLPDARVLISTDTDTLFTVQSVQVISPTTITAIMPSSKPGSRDVVVRNTDRQQAILENGFTYNPLPTIISITPNYGSSSGGTKIIIEGTGFLLGARVTIGDRAATTQVENDTTIQAVTPSNPQGVWDVRIFNPDTQEVIMIKGFISVGEMAYNYPNPFRASQGTTFRYVTDDPVQSITVKIFNLAGVPIDVVQQMDSNEVKWHNTDVHAGLYIYLMEVELENSEMRQFRNVLEIYR